MAITYPVDANAKWAVYRLSTQQIVARNRSWPRADLMEVQGQDPDYVLLQQITTERPGYDARVYTLVGTETLDIDGNTLTTTWETVKRPVEDLLVVTENEEAKRLAELVPIERELAETRLVLGAVLDMLDSQQLPGKIQGLVAKYKINTVKVWQNRDRADQIKEDIQNGIDPDLDAGWADPNA